MNYENVYLLFKANLFITTFDGCFNLYVSISCIENVLDVVVLWK